MHTLATTNANGTYYGTELLTTNNDPRLALAINRQVFRAAEREKRIEAGKRALSLCGRLPVRSRARLTKKTMISANRARGGW